MDRAKQPPPREPLPDDRGDAERVIRREEEALRAANAPDADPADRGAPNPPHTTSGNVTAPKFGSAGSGGAELEPGPPRP